MEYQTMKLASGAEVRTRGRSYEEWEACEADRLKALDEVSALADEGKPRQAENLVQRAFNEFRGKCLALWVEDWETVKKSLSLRDVAELERRCPELEKEEIQEKN